MKVSKTPFEGLLVVEPRVWDDPRGSFFEAYNQNTFREMGIVQDFVQDNQSSSRKGVLRGMHFQKSPHAQAKLVRVLTGEIQDVVVDIRKNSSTFGKHFSVLLSAANKRQLLVPAGFAHGFLVLSEQAEVLYKIDSFYNPKAEGGFHHDDPRLGIRWEIEKEQRIVSDKDVSLPLFSPALL